MNVVAARRAGQSSFRRGDVSALKFDQVTINLTGRNILSAVSFLIMEGEFVALLGPNGSGKTTLMRAALGLIPVKAGTIQVLEGAATRGNHKIGYMPQARTNLASLRFTGWDFVACAAGGQRWGLPRLSSAERHDVEQALDMVGATDLPRRSCRIVRRRAPAPLPISGAARTPQAIVP
jgi:zinc/manganese transport system ATP-binding protein